MPSLQDLQEFKASLKNIGREPFVLQESGEGYDDLPLPDTEPIPIELSTSEDAPSEVSSEVASMASLSPSNQVDEVDFSLDDLEKPSTTSSTTEEDFDFGSFLDSISEEALTEPKNTEDESVLDTGLPQTLSDQTEHVDVPENMDFSVPDDLLQGFSEEIEESRSEQDSKLIHTPQESVVEETLAGDDEGTTEQVSDILDLESSGGEELGFEETQETTELSQNPTTSSKLEEFDFSIPEFEGSFPETSPDTLPPSSSSTFGDLGSLGGSEVSEYDEFSLGSESFQEIHNDNEDITNKLDVSQGGLSGVEDFSLSGIDELFMQTKEPASIEKASEASGKKGNIPIPIVEEITLSEEDFKKLEQTLTSYPLNLRIACEELIAEQAILPEQLSTLIKMLIRGSSAKETASFASKILGRSIPIPKSFEKKTGEALEAEQASFAYIFRHRMLPILELFTFIVLLTASIFYLSFEFIYTPLKAESIYKKGFERIDAGDYQRANERFFEAFNLWRKKSWFFKYAQKFRDKRQYIYAEQKYEELLRYYPRDKKGALEFAHFEATYLNNYVKADRILRNHILDYAIDDKDGLLALGDVNLAWGDMEPVRYEEARKAFARYMERYGKEDPVLERMLKYFIRTDNLAEVLPLQVYFMESKKRKISGATLAEMGGYLLDKKLQDVKGVPDKNISRIEGLREVLERAIKTDRNIPEGYYHLARYFSKFGKPVDEQAMLEKALSVFDTAPELSSRRIGYHIDTYRRYALLLRNNREFITAQAQLVAGLKVYEDAVQRRILARSSEFGRLYADLADIEYFSAGNYESALQHYMSSLENGWAPAEVQYRIGVIHYTNKNWAEALEKFFITSLEFPLNRRLLLALGNATYMRGDYHAAQGYYNRLLDILETERSRFPMLVPNDRPDHMELVERLMMARNNLAVTLESLAEVTGDNKLRSQALALYAESSRAWDLITRDPKRMVRSGSKNLAFLNTRNSLYPIKNYERQIYSPIDKDVLEPSLWEELLEK
ncbi:periplasmic flagellar collar protein FlcA [Gracilinema caldarium]|uniref:Tetratricopeptide repeat protein n=1 Tax=Gracilinema caldarium (strain ATCC 51460 / DSM 7334 / H1) TaxID=744872 RepID=F8EZG4_GRAC1|nr:tetratricopeptide repeat protein [Gracilinema caldarium]AEJ20187.1 hypothetical protein Spica_2060 [Gracilinema caldarium DSM 7334]